MILSPVLFAFFKFLASYLKMSHLMGIHQPPKAHPQRIIQSGVMSPYLFATQKGTVRPS